MAASKLNNLMTALKALVRCGAYVIALILLAVNAYAAQGYFLKRRRSLSIDFADGRTASRLFCQCPGVSPIMRLFTTPTMVFNTFVKFALLLLASLLFSVSAHAGQATLAWDASASPGVAGYMVYYGPSSGTYSGKADAGARASYTVTALRNAQTYFYAVTAYDSGRAESAFSNEASATVSGSTAVATAVATPVSTPVTTPVAGGASTGDSSSSGGGGGGCTVGAGSGFDPTLLLLLFTAGYYFQNRTQRGART